MSVLGRTDQIIKDAVTASTAGIGAYDPAGTATGILAPEQSSAFIDMVMDDAGFLKEVDYEMKRTVEGTVSLLGVSRRNFRKKVEDSNKSPKNISPRATRYGGCCVSAAAVAP